MAFKLNPITGKLDLVNPSGSSGVNIEIPSGSVNGSNTTFNVSHTPVVVFVDGIGRRSGKGYSYSGGTITVDPLTPPTYDIFIIY